MIQINFNIILNIGKPLVSWWRDRERKREAVILAKAKLYADRYKVDIINDYIEHYLKYRRELK